MQNVNIHRINGKPVTDAMRRAMEAQYAAADKAGGEERARVTNITVNNHGFANTDQPDGDTATLRVERLDD